MYVGKALCFIMKFESPILNINELASRKLIERTISRLKPEPDNFAILSESEMSYIQCLHTESGFIVQFQNESIDEHYEFSDYLSESQTTSLFQAYLSKVEDWQGSLEYTRVNLRGFWGSLGLALGSFGGGLIRGFRDARNKT